MKRIFTLYIIALAGIATAHAQVTDEVKFDNYTSASSNDLVNNFTASSVFTQQTTGGITGGSVNPNGSHDNITYNKKYRAGDTTSVSVCFKYDAAVDKQVTSASPIELRLQPLDAFNSPGTIIYSSMNTTPSVGPFVLTQVGFTLNVSNTRFQSSALVTGHWYKLMLKAVVIADKDSVVASSYFYDLGGDGTSVPVQIVADENNKLPCVDAQYAAYMKAGFGGNVDGGCVAYDNFSATGTTYTGIADVEMQQHFTMPTIVTTTLPIHTDWNKQTAYSIYNINGALVRQGSFTTNTTVDVSDITSAMYIIRFTEGQNTLTGRFVKQ